MDASESLFKCLKTTAIGKNPVNDQNDFDDLTDDLEKLPCEDSNISLIIQHIENIKKAEEIDKALFELSKHRDNIKDIAVYIYFSTGTMAIL